MVSPSRTGGALDHQIIHVNQQNKEIGNHNWPGGFQHETIGHKQGATNGINNAQTNDLPVQKGNKYDGRGQVTN